MWDPQMASLKRDFRVLRYDTRGHGQSSVPEGDYRLDELAEDLLKLLDILHIERVHFIGLSLGGMIGQHLAARHAERVKRLMLCDTASEMPPGIWEERVATARREGMAPLVEPTIERWLTPGFRERAPEVVERVRQMIAATPAAGYAGCAAAIGALALTPMLSDITAPTCVLVGAEDASTPVSVARRLHERIAGSEFVTISNAAHVPNIEQPEAFTAEVRRFLGAERALSK